MKFKIANNQNRLEINVSDAAGHERQLLDAFEACREGRCSCPSTEYTKVEAIEIEQAAGEVHLKLTPKAGAEIDQSEIERCLQFTESQVKAEK